MEEFKKTFRLYKYAYNFKMNIVSAVLFLGLGVFMMVLFKDGAESGFMCVPAIYFGMAPILVVQMIYSLEAASLISASGKKMFYEKRFLDIVQLVYSVISYTVVVAAMLIQKKVSGARGNYSWSILCAGVTIAVLVIFSSTIVKKPVVSYFLFMSLVVLSFFGGFNLIFYQLQISMKLFPAFLFGIVIIIVGCIVSGVLRRLLFKIPLKINMTFMNRKSI